jgi:hypothetical protein
MAANRKSDQRRACRCAVALRLNASSNLLRPAVLNIWPVDVIFVKENIVQLPLIDHFSTPALVEVPFL